MIDWWLLIIMPVACYLIGSINWATIISKSKKKDIRELGSGNPGTLNMSRNFGLKFGLLTFFLDILKGAAPTLIVFFILRGRVFDGTAVASENFKGFEITHFAMYLCGLCVVLGHIYPIFMKFKGGKGIASTIGVFLVCESVNGWAWAMVAVMAIVAAAIFIYLTEFGAMGSFIAITPPAISGSIRLYLHYGAFQSCLAFYIISNMFIFIICFFTWFAHRKNIERMLAGDEHPTSIKEMIVKMKAKKARERAALKNAETEKTDSNIKDGL